MDQSDDRPGYGLIRRKTSALLIRILTVRCTHCIWSVIALGFTFAGAEEPTALLQHDGGPCAVIVAVQAFLLKHLLFTESFVPERWRHTSGEP